MLITEAHAVSVVMPVHNAVPYLDAAVESILGQSFGDFEFVILDDASTDGSTQRLRQWASRDARIRLLEEKRNLGPARSSDRVARAASAAIVARMDADDISYPQRLADQLAVLDRYPSVGVVGGLFDIIDADGRIVRGPEPWRLRQPASIPPFGNGPLTYRREVFDQVGGYREECEFWEDNDLILRMAAVTKIMVLPYPVYQVRQACVSNRLSTEQLRVERGVDLMYRARTRLEQGLSYDDLLAIERRPQGQSPGVRFSRFDRALGRRTAASVQAASVARCTRIRSPLSRRARVDGLGVDGTQYLASLYPTAPARTKASDTPYDAN